ncbi:MAG: glutamate-1-semialdehyde 2,1-aminomutase [Elusimicrobia bacterium]|jgi:glutamate-1-semialdehyde 2,1-aminomutase|nr:glutamate-1-semialdehyde 2,1-aminomutase [Elusimicrobiota bacterium]
MTRSQTLFKQAQKIFVGGVNSPVRAFRAVGGTPVFMARARGSTLTDVDNKKYVDYVGSWGPLILGHAHPVVVQEARRALEEGSSFGAPSPRELALAHLVRQAYPTVDLLRFTSSGTEACLSALRLARGTTGRSLIVKFAGCYHGHGDSLLVSAGSGALTLGHPTSAGVPKELARLTLVLPYNDPVALAKVFSKWGKKIAAVIVEPVVGNMGVVSPSPEFQGALQNIPRRHGALLIVDEVMTGFRLAWGGAQEWLGLQADITCFGKILGGGFPVGAFGGPKRLMEKVAPLGPVYQAGTLSGNPVAMAAGAATLALLKKSPPYGALRKKTKLLTEGLRDLARRQGVEVTVNNVGSMFTVFFTPHPVTDLVSAEKSNTAAYGRFFHGLLKRGVYFPPSQFEASFVSAAHSIHDIEKTLSAAQAAFREV